MLRTSHQCHKFNPSRQVWEICTPSQLKRKLFSLMLRARIGFLVALVSRLDGGRIVQALYGRIAAGRISSITLFLQVLGAILGNSPLLLYWGLIAVLFQSRPDIPSQDEVTEPNDTRSALGLVALVLMVLILAPYPEAAQQAAQTMQTMQNGRM
mmetsp:Transcript_38576/g.152212  ORF Transcript_38576/g.152212 Transcript_38576/m.152212 type:complete len:154 (-) Transcript_38576:268-729(-)